MSTINTYLEDEEIVLMKILPNSGFMFHLYDIISIGFACFCLTIGVLVFSFSGYILFLLFGMIVPVILGYKLYQRYNRSANTTYYVTPKRIIFKRNMGQITSKWFRSIEEFTFENKGSNKGYIIIGKMNTPFDNLLSGKGFLFKRQSVNFDQNKYILDNLSNYKEVSNLIKKLKNKAKQ